MIERPSQGSRMWIRRHVASMRCLVPALAASLLVLSPAAADDRSTCNSLTSVPDEGTSACNRLIESGRFRGRGLASLMLSRGIHWRHKGDLDRALADETRAIEIDPKFGPAYLGRGNIWSDKRNFDRALDDYNTAIRLGADVNLALAYNNRGTTWQAKGELDRALADLDEAIKRGTKGDPNLVLAYANRGNVWRAKGELDRAIEDYDRVIAADPQRFAVYVDRGFLWHRKELAARSKGTVDRAASERAMQDFAAAIRINPKYDTAYVNRGVTRANNNDLDGALADYGTAISLNPNNAIPYGNRCIIRRRKADLDGALADCSAALRIDPGFTSALMNRGQIYESKGDRAAARADYTRALELPPKYDTGKAAQDTARARLAVLGPAQVQPNAPVVVAPPAAGGDRRLALVIGNGAYGGDARLDNAANDGRAVAKALRDIGFQVIEGVDLDHAGMRRVLIDFLVKAPEAKIALMFYAGHGLQIDGRNYLAPIDAKLVSETTVSIDFIDVERQILDGLSDEARINVLILDACRNNPFTSGKKSSRRTSGLARASSHGALMAYATDPDNTAEDGDGPHSPFTTALLKYISDPNLEIVTMLRKVQLEVQTATKRAQNPYLDLPPLGEVYLARGARRAAAQ